MKNTILLLIQSVLVIILVILLGNMIWGIPVEISDQANAENWTDHFERIEKEIRNERIKSGLLLMMIFAIFIGTRKCHN